MAVVQIKQARQVETSPEPERGVLQLHGFNLSCGSQLTHGELAWQSWDFHDISTGNDATPLWIPQIGMALGTLVLLIAFVDELVMELRGQRVVLASDEALHNE